MDMWDGMQPKLDDNMPQMIFAEDRGEVLQVRKQDNRFGVAKDEEILLAIEAFADWQLKSGITDAELEQARDIIRRERLGIEGR